MVMSKCQTVLENADTPDVLFAIVDVILFIVKNHPHCFRPHFRVSVCVLLSLTMSLSISATQLLPVVQYLCHAEYCLLLYLSIWLLFPVGRTYCIHLYVSGGLLFLSTSL